MVGNRQQAGKFRQDLRFHILVEPLLEPERAQPRCCGRTLPLCHQRAGKDDRPFRGFGLRLPKGGKNIGGCRVLAVKCALGMGAKRFEARPPLQFALGVGDLVGGDATLPRYGDCPSQNMTIERALVHAVSNGDRLGRILVGKRIQTDLQAALNGRYRRRDRAGDVLT